jgi:GNAT superfamily N-acetyltransferase
MNFQIHHCTLNDIQAYAEHSVYHLTEKGIDDIFVHPFPSDYKRDVNEFVGHLTLRCGGIPASAHRARLGMGIEKPYRSMGIGQALMTVAVQWAREQDSISWIDLSVFSKNRAARSLYSAHGFKEVYTITDALRIENEIIDDVQMTLKV